jgi:hypothetical protein
MTRPSDYGLKALLKEAKSACLKRAVLCWAYQADSRAGDSVRAAGLDLEIRVSPAQNRAR